MIYQIVSAESLNELTRIVSERVQHDWICAGGPFTYCVFDGARLITEARTLFAQALISYQNPHNEPPSGTAPR